MTSPADHQALALRSWHRLACEGHAQEPARAAAEGEATVLAAYREPRSSALDSVRAQALLLARRVFPYVEQPTCPKGEKLTTLLDTGFHMPKISLGRLLFPRACAWLGEVAAAVGEHYAGRPLV